MKECGSGAASTRGKLTTTTTTGVTKSTTVCTAQSSGPGGRERRPLQGSAGRLRTDSTAKPAGQETASAARLRRRTKDVGSPSSDAKDGGGGSPADDATKPEKSESTGGTATSSKPARQHGVTAKEPLASKKRLAAGITNTGTDGADDSVELPNRGS